MHSLASVVNTRMIDSGRNTGKKNNEQMTYTALEPSMFYSLDICMSPMLYLCSMTEVLNGKRFW